MHMYVYIYIASYCGLISYYCLYIASYCFLILIELLLSKMASKLAVSLIDNNCSWNVV